MCAVTCTCIIQNVENKILQYIIFGLYLGACLFDDSFMLFIPVLIYDLSRKKLYPMGIPAFAILTFRFFQGLTLANMAGILVFSLMAFLLEQLDRKVNTLKKELIVTRDDAVEYNNELKEKNRQLLEAQDAQIHVATLKERNRIAREIHDNVGHMLTRTILQTGALQIVNKDENLKEPLESIKNTLDEAMNQVRKSVHDLHDDSIDLEASLKEAVLPLKEKFELNYEYDITREPNGKIKYCFIAIVKEAVNNILKHSNGNKAVITVREHPGMYTLAVYDNGKCPETIKQGGIGLVNMRERVYAIGGNINISSGTDGFKILASIMK